jgi:hypothetical protein
MNYIAALAMDQELGILESFDSLPPDTLIRNPYFLKSKSKSDPDTPGIAVALNG